MRIVLSAIDASTVGSNDTTATMPASAEPEVPPERALTEPPVPTDTPPAEIVIAVEESVAFTSRLAWAKVSTLFETTALVVLTALTTATDAPAAMLRPLPAESGRSVRFEALEKIDPILATIEPATVTTRSSVTASTSAPRRLVPVTRSIVASVVVTSRCAEADPAKFTVRLPVSPTVPLAPLTEMPPMIRAFFAATSRL